MWYGVPPVKALLEWESRVILGEETWSFAAQGDAETILTRLRSEVDEKNLSRGIPLRLRWYRKDKEFIGHVQHDRIELMRKVNPIMWAFGNRHYAFSGRITSSSLGSVMTGRYKICGWTRVVFLVVLNVFLLLSAGFLIGLAAKAIASSAGDLTFRLQELAWGIGFLFLSTLIFLSVFRFLKFLDVRNRDAMHNFLTQVTRGNSRPGEEEKQG